MLQGSIRNKIWLSYGGCSGLNFNFHVSGTSLSVKQAEVQFARRLRSAAPISHDLNFQSGSSEHATIADTVNQAKQHTREPTLIASGVAWRYRTRLRRQLITVDEALRDVLHYCQKHKKSKPKKPLLAELLVELIHILSEHEYPKREVVRRILLLLHEVSNDTSIVRREIYFYEYSSTIVPIGNRPDLYKKMFYMMNMVAGWQIPQPNQKQPNYGTRQFYIDLPLSPYMPFADNNVLSEAVYRIQDEKIMLQALRCGAFVPGILLWPIGMVLDLHRALQVPLDLSSKESLFIRYFCRTRRWIWVGLMPVTNSRPHGVNIPDDISRDDILLLPDSASCLVPEDRYLEPASMKQQCRLEIRRALLGADNLPDGPQRLPLPTSLIQYVDLLID